MLKTVAQYELSGRLVAVYESVKEAALLNSLSLDFLYHLLRKEKREYKGYIWQAVKSTEPCPKKITGLPKKPDKSEILRKKFSLTRHQYPFLDKNLLDLEGEIWKPIPGFEEYYMVSNLGRVKRLAGWSYYIDGRKRFEEERIIIQTRATNRTHNMGYLMFRIHFEAQKHSMVTARAVYSAFIKPLKPIKTNRLFVLHKDLDSFNNRIENLYLATDKELADRNIKEGWNPFACNKPEIQERLKEQKSKAVSQYDMSGKHIYTYPSVREAFRQTGIDQKSIINTAKKKARHAGKFIWRYGANIDNPDEITLSE